MHLLLHEAEFFLTLFVYFFNKLQKHKQSDIPNSRDSFFCNSKRKWSHLFSEAAQTGRGSTGRRGCSSTKIYYPKEIAARNGLCKWHTAVVQSEKKNKSAQYFHAILSLLILYYKFFLNLHCTDFQVLWASPFAKFRLIKINVLISSLFKFFRHIPKTVAHKLPTSSLISAPLTSYVVQHFF